VLIVLCVSLPACALAKEAKVPPRKMRQSLPDQPESSDEQPGYLNLDCSELTVGYDTRINKWSASADYGTEDSPVLSAYYGVALGRKLASGASVVVGNDRKEIFVNEVFSPQKSLRLRFAGG
jgi:hypothetical protein